MTRRESLLSWFARSLARSLSRWLWCLLCLRELQTDTATTSHQNTLLFSETQKITAQQRERALGFYSLVKKVFGFLQRFTLSFAGKTTQVRFSFTHHCFLLRVLHSHLRYVLLFMHLFVFIYMFLAFF